MSDQDTEITLGTGRLLGLFFALVALCGLFFGLGFSLGHNSARPEMAAVTMPPPAAVTTAAKPSAAKPAAEPKADCADPNGCAQPASSDELSFYKAVEQKDANAQLQPAAQPAAAAAAPAADAQPAKAGAPEMVNTATSGGYMVQVAAVTKSDDADALVSALRKKEYPVFVATVPSDKLFHVQVGPFAEMKDADAMKQKLVGDGYNPIVKK